MRLTFGKNKPRRHLARRHSEQHYATRVLKEMLQDTVWKREYAAAKFGVRVDAVTEAEREAIIQAMKEDPDIRSAVARAYIDGKLAEIRSRYGVSVGEESDAASSIGSSGGSLSGLAEEVGALLEIVQMARDGLGGEENNKKNSFPFSIPDWAMPLLMAKMLGVPLAMGGNQGGAMPSGAAPSGYPAGFPFGPPPASPPAGQPELTQQQAAGALPTVQGVGPAMPSAPAAAPSAQRTLPLLDPNFIWSLHERAPHEAAAVLYTAIEEFSRTCDPISRAALDWFRVAISESSWEEVLAYLESYRNDPVHGPLWGRVFDFLRGQPEWSTSFFGELRKRWGGESLAREPETPTPEEVRDGS